MCLTASTRISLADNGGEVALGNLMLRDDHPLVWTLNERQRITAKPLAAVVYGGRKEAFRLRLTSGREVEVTTERLFMTAPEISGVRTSKIRSEGI